MAIVCLVPGGPCVKGRAPTGDLLERLERVAEFFRPGYNNMIVVTGGIKHKGAEISESEAAYYWLLDSGIPWEYLFREDTSVDTLTDIEGAWGHYGNSLRKKGAVICIVSQYFHAAKVRRMLLAMGIPEEKIRILSCSYGSWGALKFIKDFAVWLAYYADPLGKSRILQFVQGFHVQGRSRTRI